MTNARNTRRFCFARAAGAATALAASSAGATAAEPLVLNLNLAPEFEMVRSAPLLPGDPDETRVDGRSRPKPFALFNESDAAAPGFVFGESGAPPDFRFTGANGASQTVAVKAKGLPLDPGTIDLTAAFAQHNLGDDVTVARLMAPGPFEAANVSTFYTGAKAMWREQFSLSAAAAASETRTIANSAFRDVGGAPAANAVNAGALWLGMRADLGEADGLKWTIVGQLATVDDGFRAAGARSARPEGAVAIAGERGYAMTSAALDGFALSAATHSLTRDDGTMTSRRATLAHDWANLTVVERDVARSITGIETHSVATALELYPSEVLPDLGFLTPTLVSLELATQTATSLATPASERRSVLSADAVWSSEIGETMVSYWQSGPEGQAQGGDLLIDATHSVAWADWRVSAGITRMAFHDGATSDVTIAAYGGIAFRPKDRLRVELALERTRNALLDAFANDLDSYDRLDLRVAIDAAPLLSAVFDMGAATATFEARQTIDRFVADASAGEETAIAATFAAPL